MQESSTAPADQHRGARRRLALTLASLALALGADGACRADGTIYRCTAPDGSIEFRQIPCQGSDQAEKVELGPDNQGWESPPEVKRPTRKPKRRNTRSAAERIKAEKQQEQRCWKKQQQLDKVRHRLRRGYKAGQGEKLRRQRDEAADYIRQFCR